MAPTAPTDDTDNTDSNGELLSDLPHVDPDACYPEEDTWQARCAEALAAAFDSLSVGDRVRLTLADGRTSLGAVKRTRAYEEMQKAYLTGEESGLLLEADADQVTLYRSTPRGFENEERCVEEATVEPFVLPDALPEREPGFTVRQHSGMGSSHGTFRTREQAVEYVRDRWGESPDPLRRDELFRSHKGTGRGYVTVRLVEGDGGFYCVYDSVDERVLAKGKPEELLVQVARERARPVEADPDADSNTGRDAYLSRRKAQYERAVIAEIDPALRR